MTWKRLNNSGNSLPVFNPNDLDISSFNRARDSTNSVLVGDALMFGNPTDHLVVINYLSFTLSDILFNPITGGAPILTQTADYQSVCSGFSFLSIYPSIFSSYLFNETKIRVLSWPLGEDDFGTYTVKINWVEIGGFAFQATNGVGSGIYNPSDSMHSYNMQRWKRNLSGFSSIISGNYYGS